MLRFLLCCAAVYFTSTIAEAHSPDSAAVSAHYYRYVEFPRQLRELDHAIRLRKAEIASLELRLAEWEPFDRFRTGRPLVVTIENARLLLLEAKLDLERLEYERFDLNRYYWHYAH